VKKSQYSFNTGFDKLFYLPFAHQRLRGKKSNTLLIQDLINFYSFSAPLRLRGEKIQGPLQLQQLDVFPIHPDLNYPLLLLFQG
jgi:hypothetical protein